MTLQLNDFHKQNIKFDVNKLREACDQVLKVKGFDTSLGIPHFASISLNRIPGDPESIKEIRQEEFIGQNQILLEKRFQEMLELTRVNILNLLKITKILILKKCIMFLKKNIN